LFSKIANYLKGKICSKKNGSDVVDDETEDDDHDSTVETHYDMLHVTPDAPAKVIRMVYIALLRKYHPDRNVHNPEATAMSQLINEAYQVLADPQKRAAHDQSVLQQQPKTATASHPQKSDPQLDKLKAEAVAWENLRIKAEEEARRAREYAVKIARNAAAATLQDKPRLDSWAAQAAADAKKAEEKVGQRTAEAKDAAAKIHALGIRPVSEKTLLTHYAALKISRFAPREVIDAAYTALIQECGALREIEDDYKVLSHPQTKSDYDARLEQQMPKKIAAAGRSPKTRKPSEREKEAREKADQATALAAAMASLAERAARTVKELQEKSLQVTKSAEENAQGKDAKKWADWAKKLAGDVSDAQKFAQRAVVDAQNAEIKAKDSVAAASVEKTRAERLAVAEAATAEKRRSIRESAEKTELAAADAIIIASPPSKG